MAWQIVTTLAGGSSWSYSPVVPTGDFFRLTYAASPPIQIKGLIAQVELGNPPQFFGYRRFWTGDRQDVLFLPLPPCFSSRAIGIYQFWASRAVTIEVWDGQTGFPPIVLVP